MKAMTAAAVSRDEGLPGVIVGRSTIGATPPLGLGEPFALMGGDRLGADGIPFAFMHEWQPELFHAVSSACLAQAAAKRPWFWMPPVLLTGPAGVGRTHAARALAHASGVAHILLDLSDTVVAASIAGKSECDEKLWASPLVTGMAASRCANPIVSIVNAKDNAEAAVALGQMIDPDAQRTCHERNIATVVDLSHVIWIVQSDDTDSLPSVLVEHLHQVSMAKVQRDHDTLALFSLVMEVLRDLEVDPKDPVLSWQAIISATPESNRDPTAYTYRCLRKTVLDILYQQEVARVEASAMDEPPF